jgi:hypothetical protein
VGLESLRQGAVRSSLVKSKESVFPSVRGREDSHQPRGKPIIAVLQVLRDLHVSLFQTLSVRHLHSLLSPAPQEHLHTNAASMKEA